ASKMPAAELVVNGNTLSAKIPVLAGSVRMNLIIQASQVSSSTTSGTIIFPSAFPNACVMILAHDFAIAASDLSNVRFYMPGKSSASWYGQYMNTGGEISPATWGWLAIGW
ncbi:gp53-like domain-containing protein, partial [Escherichia coli]